MKVQIKRDEEFIDLNKVVIRINEVDFRISVNKFDELVINKYQSGDGEGSLMIIPNVSNEIIIK